MVFLHLLSTFPRQTSDLSRPYPRHFDQWWRQSAACYRCLWREKDHRRRVTDMWLLQHRSKSPKGQTWFKVAVHLQGCLAYKQCSASGLNCRYLNPYIKLKLIGLATRLYQKFWKKNELSNFSRLLTASARITFWKLHVKANFVFRLFNVFFRFRGQSAKNNVSAICHIQFQWKVTEHFRNRIKKIWSVRTKIALIVKIFRKKNFADTFLLFMC